MDSYTKEVIDLFFSTYSLKKLKETDTHIYWIKESRSQDYDFYWNLITNKKHDEVKKIIEAREKRDKEIVSQRTRP